MRLEEQRWAYGVERRRLMLENTLNGDFVVRVFGSIIGFAILFAMMFHVYSASQ